MSLLAWLRAFVKCQHRHSYMERRKLHNLLVMHTVCPDCGRAKPVMERTAKEHRAAVKVGATPTAKVIRTSARVTPITKGKRA